MNQIRLGTRGSRLALWQANKTKNELVSKGIDVDIKVIKTKGDKVQHLSFDKIEGKGFFTKEIEDALLNLEIDLAVHSLKDLPTGMNSALTIAGVSNRADPADWLIIDPSSVDSSQTLKLKYGARVGTSSARRKCQLLSIRKDLKMIDIRGNVPTRLQKLLTEDFDAIMLAAAGLTRLELDLSSFKVVKLHPREFVPAPAQGVLAYQVRTDDIRMRRLIADIHQSGVADLSNVERLVLSMFEGGCHMPLGVYCEKDAMGNYHAWGAYAEALNQPLRLANLSYNTTVGLAEGLYKKLLKED